ncbi:MAG: transcriptional regulator [Bacteroidetes bacterium CG02_land_8_20_14_3_00_31_25]|nr:MAG: transcriptional regulator [Bacteroidetes bacterium CG02_land_8_20_14_3_00_31_25]
MLDTLITSKTRIKLLLKFFLNSNSSAYLRSLECEFGESTNGIRVELNRFEKAGLLQTFVKGNKKMFRANIMHPMFNDIQNLLKKYIGIDQIIDKVINRLGKIRQVYITGAFASGKNSKIIDLLIIADDIDRNYLSSLVEKTEKLIKRHIRYAIMNDKELNAFIKQNNELLLIWAQQ